MTKEEKLVEEWLDERYLKDMGVRNQCKKAFLAGLKAGKQEKWHDLRKDPNDLPSPHCLNWVIALYDNGSLWCRARRKECVDGVFWVNSEYYPIDNVLAWKEITLPAQ